MNTDTSALINEWVSRSKLNTYSELGRKVGVSQQTVSRWAHGINEPSPEYNKRIFNAISLDYPMHDQNISFGSPRLNPLPVEKLTPSAFEDFCLDLFRYIEFDDIDKLGKKGDRQYGIDLYSNNKKTVIQCKQTKETKFSKTDDVIKEYDENGLTQRLKYTPQRKILAVSANVTDTKVQKLEGDGWEVYDIEKLSRLARDLQKNQKVRLVERFFSDNQPTILKYCLGIDNYTFGLTPAEQYFNHIDKKQACFTLSNQYISSFSKLETLNDSFQKYHSKTTPFLPIIIIAGDSGVGKTRLLKEFCNEHRGLDIVVIEGDIGTKDDIACAFESDAIIIDNGYEYIDNGREYTNTIRRLLSTYSTSYVEEILQKKKPVLILSVRSAYLDQIKGTFYDSRIGEDNYTIIELKKPTCGECYNLVKEIINNGGIAQTITSFSSNNPLIATTLATGVRDGQLSQLSIEKLGAPGSILHAYLNNLAKYKCGLSRREDDARSILDIIALVQPVNVDENIIDVIKNQTGLSPSTINTIIEKLLTAGILVKRRNKIHIYPDILGVYVCYEYLKSGFESKNGVLRSLLNSQYQINTLLNLALLDSDKPTTINNIMSEAWKTVEKNYISSSVFERQKILNSLVDVSFYQPREAIDFAKIILSLDGNSEKNNSIESPNNPLRTVASILEHVSHRADYIDEAMHILVELASKFETEEPKNNPALNVIQNLLRPNISKPVGYRKKILDSLLLCIKNRPDQKIFIKLLSSSLDISSTSYSSDEKTITLLQSSHNNSDDESKKICKTILEYSELAINNGNLPLKIAAIELLGDIINYKLNESDNSQDKTSIINYLYCLCEKEIDPLTVAKIYLELQRCYKNTNQLDSLLKNTNSIIAVFALDPYHHDLLSYETDYEKRQARLKEWIDRNAALVTKEYANNPDALYDTLASIREKADECKILFKASYLLGIICPKMPNSFNKQLIQSIRVEDPGEELQYAVKALLASSKEKQYCIDIIKAFVKPGNRKSIIAAASTIAYCFDIMDTKTSLEMINLIVKTNDTDAILILTQYSYLILDHDENAIQSLLLCFCGIKDPRVALQVTELFSGHNGKKRIDNLQQKDVEIILSALENSPELDYSAQTFICNVANVFPNDTISFLLNRISRKHISLEYDIFSYTDIPYGMTIKLEKNALDVFLTGITSWICNNINQPMMKYDARKLLKTICIDERTLLREATKAKDRYVEDKSITSRIIVEIFLSMLSIRYIANNYDIIEPILHSLMTDGDISKKEILDIFVVSYVPSSKSRTPGNPSEYDLQLMGVSEKALLVMPYDSILRQLFERVKKYAEQEIANDKKMDEEWGL